MQMRMRGPSTYTVLAVDVPKGRDVEVAHFSTVEEARECADQVRGPWEIWLGDHIAEESGPTPIPVWCPRCRKVVRGLVESMGMCQTCAEA